MSGSSTKTIDDSCEIATAPSPSQNAICPLLNEHAFECPICLELLIEPITLQCGHTYCKHCISQWIVSHTLSKSSKQRQTACKCPSCKSRIYNKFSLSISFTLRDFLKNQFTAKYQKRYNFTRDSRIKCSKQLTELKQIRDADRRALRRCCGIIRIKKWVVYNSELLHFNTRSWLWRWLFLYGLLLSVLIPFLMAIIADKYWKIDRKDINLYFMDDIFEYVGLNTISKISSTAISWHLFQDILQYFGAIVAIKNTAFLPDNYILSPNIPYDTLPDIYASDSTDLYYRNLFRNWKSSELKTFVKVHDIDDTCFERYCYTDTIVEYLKIDTWNMLKTDPLPISLLQEYLNHYNVDYNECLNGFWSKDYECFAKKAANIKIFNDVYYSKKYLLSVKSQQRERNDSHKQEKKEKKEKVFGFHDIGDLAFNVLSGFTY